VMQYQEALVAVLLVAMVGCHANTGHSLRMGGLPETASWETDAALQFEIEAPGAWKSMRLRLGSPEIVYSTTGNFASDNQQAPCEVETVGEGGLAIACSLPTRGATPGTEFEYRLEYTFDGYREGKIAPTRTLRVIADCPGGWWKKQDDFGCNEPG